MNKTLSPKLDIVFQAIFGEVGSEKITKDFLEKILDRKIYKIDLSKNPILRRKYQDDKLGILDILVELNGNEQCNIELQIIDQKNIIDRMLFYWSRLYSGQLKAGDNYKETQKTIVILISDFKLEGLEELNYLSKWKIIEANGRKKILTDKFELCIIELSKIEGKENLKDKLLDWLYFLENPKSERVTKIMEENEAIKEAVEKVNTLSEDEEMQRLAYLREKGRRERSAIYDKGIEEGIKKEAKQIAKKLKEMGISVEDIKKATNLNKDEIEKL